jgi:hypothetical protein
VRKTVDPLTREMRNGGQQFLVLRLGRLIESGANGIEARHLYFVCAINEIPIEIDVSLHLRQTLNVLFLRSHSAS